MKEVNKALVWPGVVISAWGLVFFIALKTGFRSNMFTEYNAVFDNTEIMQHIMFIAMILNILIYRYFLNLVLL
jgi:hypothetical protein